MNIYSKLIGSDGEYLLIVHGGPDWDHSYLVEAAQELSKRYRVILFDIRGCGRSKRYAQVEEYTVAKVAGDIADLLKWYRVHRCAVLGFSFGAAVVVKFLALYPEMVKEVILCSAQLIKKHGGRSSRISQDLLKEQKELLDSGSGFNIAKRMAEMTLAIDINSEENIEKARKALSKICFSDEWVRAYRGDVDFELCKEPVQVLNDAAVPVLIVHGEKDRRFPAENALALHESLCNSQLVLLPDCGHLAHLENCGLWGSVILDNTGNA